MHRPRALAILRHAASELDEDGGNPDLVADLRALAEELELEVLVAPAPDAQLRADLAILAAIGEGRTLPYGAPIVDLSIAKLRESVAAAIAEASGSAPSTRAAEQGAEIDRLRAWIDDLQSGLFVNCVYCGHRYGPAETTPVSKADALKAHIAQCPEHPMANLLAACKAQHDAIDWLMASLAQRDKTFLPTKSPVWPAVQQGHAAITSAEIAAQTTGLTDA